MTTPVDVTFNLDIGQSAALDNMVRQIQQLRQVFEGARASVAARGSAAVGDPTGVANLRQQMRTTAQVMQSLGLSPGAIQGGVNAQGQLNLTQTFGSGGTNRGAGVGRMMQQGLARLIPGGNIGMAFKSIGLIGGIATAVLAIVGFVKSIFQNSQILTTFSRNFMKVFGILADMLLMPFLPLMTKVLVWIIQNLFPEVQNLGLLGGDQSSGEVFGNVLGSMVNIGVKVGNAIIEQIPAILTALVDAIPTVLTVLVDAIPTVLTAVIEGLPPLIMAIVEAIPEIIIAVVDAIPSIISAIIEAIPQIITALVELLPQLVTALVESLPEIIIAVVEAIPQIIVALINGIPDIIIALIKAIPDIIVALVKAIPDIINAFINLIPRVVTALVVGIITEVPPALRDALVKALDFRQGLKEAAISGGETLIGGIRDKFSGNSTPTTDNSVTTYTFNFGGVSDTQQVVDIFEQQAKFKDVMGFGFVDVIKNRNLP